MINLISFCLEMIRRMTRNTSTVKTITFFGTFGVRTSVVKTTFVRPTVAENTLKTLTIARVWRTVPKVVPVQIIPVPRQPRRT